ncbi:MAG: aminopeptidase [Phycisphaerae bacterium]|nr:aminopeptidase [Phycisphaerae bacterium]NUQ47945.1 aminopeptidase [Phycisphaerae bacterium]
MTDPRIEKLADVLINYSCALKPGERVLIEAIDVPHAFTKALIRHTHAAGGMPFVLLKSNEIDRALRMKATEEQFALMADVERMRMEKMQCYIGARGSHNVSELSDVPGEGQQVYERTIWRRVHKEVRVKKTRWVVLRWPHPSMAQMAEMSTESFEEFYFNVCTLDYARMSRAMQPLKELMEKTDIVHLKGPRDTDLTFSIKGIPAVPCDGKLNIPDGEVFTAPVRDSVNGVIQFNAPTIYRGMTHNDIRLVFRNGKVVEARSSASDKLNEVLDADEGARYVGEFAIGFNPYCVKPMKDILFDEKIAGSIHFTPGACYDEASNGNKSNIHWDMVMIQTPEHGGGEMHFDGRLIRKDGRFVVKDLEGLNPENLK